MEPFRSDPIEADVGETSDALGETLAVDPAAVDMAALTAAWSRTLGSAFAIGATLKADTADRTTAGARTPSRLSLREIPVAQPGRHLDPPPSFELCEKIGEGGMGVVHAARQTAVDREVAIKAIKPEVAADEIHRAKFLAEAAVNADLDHPGVPPLYDLGMDEQGTLFYAMRRVTGRPWSEVLREKSLPENLEILLRVADAVSFAHSRSILHRDLKPENVMLGDFGEVYLMDWGLAACIPDRPASGRPSAPPLAQTVRQKAEQTDTVDFSQKNCECESAKTNDDSTETVEFNSDASTNLLPVPPRPTNAESKAVVPLLGDGTPTRRCKAEALTQSNAAAGTPAYMAPEMALGDPARIGVHSDVYLLGAILYEIAGGTRPHGGGTLNEVISNIIHNVLLPTETRGELIDIARKAMATDPTKRYPGVRAFQQAIRDYQTHAESLAMCEEAEKDLHAAAKTKSYDDFARAMFTYEQALKLWAENKTAMMGTRTARLAYANCAFEKEDYSQSLSLLEAGGLGKTPLAKRVRDAKNERERKIRRAKTMTRAAVALTAAVVILVLAAGWWISREQAKTAKALASLVEEEKKATAAKLAVFEEEKRRREEWLPVCDFDFAKANELDPRFEAVFCAVKDVHTNEQATIPVPDLPQLEDGLLVLPGRLPNATSLTDRASSGLGILRWREEIGDAMRLTAIVPGGGNCGFAVGGDSLHGYRLICVLPKGKGQTSSVELDDIEGGGHRVLASAQHPIDSELDEHEITIQKAGSRILVWVDGVLQIDYFDPLLKAGRGYRTFSLSAFHNTLRMRKLLVERRKSPELVSVLEAGKEMLRRGRLTDAEDFFAEQAHAHGEDPVGQEALLLLAMARERLGNSAAAREGCRSLLAISGANRELLLAGWGLMARLHLEAKKYPEASEAALKAYAIDPDTRVVYETLQGLLAVFQESRKTSNLNCSISTLDRKTQNILLEAIARLPVTRLDLSGTGLTTLAPLAGMELTWLQCNSNNLRDIEALRGMPLTYLMMGNNRIRDLSPLRGMPLRQLNIDHNPVSDLSPLRESPLAGLTCNSTRVTDLSPLKGMSIKHLQCWYCGITDISPLEGMPLRYLFVQGNAVSDIAPLHGMPLESLPLAGNLVQDLSPLADCPLQGIDLNNMLLRDISPLAKVPLKGIALEYRVAYEISSPLRNHPTLELINETPVEEFWHLYDSGLMDGQTPSEKWKTDILIENKKLAVETPALPSLEVLRGLTPNELIVRTQGLKSLSGIEGMPLSGLAIVACGVEDLSALKGMPLSEIFAPYNNISDLSPMTGLPLTWLTLNGNPVSDLRPLQGMQLWNLYLGNTHVRDLSPLKGIPLSKLDLNFTPVQDLSPLRGMQIGSLLAFGIPLDKANQEILMEMAIYNTTLDLMQPGAQDFLTQHPTLRKVNGLSVEYALEMLPLTRRALAGEAGLLRPLASRSGDLDYFALPQWLPIAEARALAVREGGRLICPSTNRKKQALLRYMVDRCWCPIGPPLLVGARLDPSAEEWRWDSGEPWQEPPAPHYHRSRLEQSEVLALHESWELSPRDPLLPGLVILEWDAEENSKEDAPPAEE